MAVVAGEDTIASQYLDEGRMIAGSLDDPYLSALARLQDAWLLTEDDRWSDALAILDDIIPVLRDLGAWEVAIPANRTRAWMYEQLSDMDRFWLLTEENLEHSRVHGHRRIEARSLGALAERAGNEGRLEDEREFLVESLRIDRELGNVLFVSIDLVRFAVVHAREARPDIAVRLISRAAAEIHEKGFSLESWMAKEIDDATAAVRAQPTARRSPRPGKRARS